MTQAGYIDTTDITAYGFQTDLSTNQSLFDKLIVRASRLFDIMCGVEPGHFIPIHYPIWQSLHDYAVGDLITPRTPNGHRYQITTAGTSGASEPVYPVTPAGTVTNGSIVLTEHGSDALPAATDKVIYGSGGVILAIPPHVGDVVSVIPGSGFVLPKFIEEQNGYLKVVDLLGRTQDVGVAYIGGGLSGTLQSALVWQRGVPFTVTAVWGFAATPDTVKQAVTELTILFWRSKDEAWTKAINVDSNQMTFNPAIPKRVKVIAASFRNARASVSAFV